MRLIREEGLTGLLQKAVRWNKSDAMEAEERAALLRDWEDRDAAFGMLNYYRGSPLVVPEMGEPFALPDGWKPPVLPNLAIPTLVIWAMDDLALPASNLDGLDAFVDNLRIERVEGCGHFVPWEAPDRFNSAMETFLRADT